MQASIIDLRYKMKNVLQALARNETVEVHYHGKLKGILAPAHAEEKQRVKDHPFFGCDQNIDVNQTMQALRKGRFS